MVPLGTITCIIAFCIVTHFGAIIESWIPTFVDVCISSEEYQHTCTIVRIAFIDLYVVRTLATPMEVWVPFVTLLAHAAVSLPIWGVKAFTIFVLTCEIWFVSSFFTFLIANCPIKHQWNLLLL
jgi:hypothetical protein